MRKTVLTILAASLFVGSTLQIAGAAERYTHKSDRARVHTTEQFRNANDSLASPSVEQQDLSDYSEGHVISAPAGHRCLCVNTKSPTERRGFLCEPTPQAYPP